MTKDVDRRAFVRSALAGGAVLFAPQFTGLSTHRRRTTLADARIDVLLDDPIGTIAPEIYGHFVEHLGGVVYGGIWVGEDSPIPNVDGVRKALADAFKAIHPAVIRWPGGCFADSYDWRDGIGPKNKRPRRTNFWANDPQYKKLGNIPAVYDPNTFGTDEFLHFCHLVGAQPYLAANVRELPARVFIEWLEYCNSPIGSTTLADARAANGDPDPFNVRFWGIGNEAWGCGGNFTPEEYAEEFRRFTTWSVPTYGLDLAFVGSGPSGGDVEWTRRFFAAMAERRDVGRMWGWSMHHYCSADGAGANAVAFDERGWYDLLASADRMDGLINTQWTAMGEYDRRRHVKLVVDEWGAWHKTAPLEDQSHLFESQSTIRDAVVAGLTLDTFNRHADKVAMANVAQLDNCIQSLFFTHDDKLVLTPVYHVFAMYAAHQGGQAVRTQIAAPRESWTAKDGSSRSLWGLAGSASVTGKTLVLTVTNPAMSDARETEIAVRGGNVTSVRATTLSAHDVHDVNSFDHPNTVTPSSADVPVRGGSLVYTFPAASVTKLEIALGN